MNSKDKKQDAMRKSPVLYIIMLVIWTILTAFLWYHFVKSFINIPFVPGTTVTTTVRVLATILLVLNSIFISYFWLNGVKDFIYVVWYFLNKKRLNKKFYRIINTDVSNVNDRILMVYCTCNDFDGSSLKKSMEQTYKNVRTVILDDSNDEEYKRKVDEFGRENNVEVVRRPDRKGFKAGNINHYLMSDEVRNSVGGGYDFVVILDSDEILPHNYIVEALKYFYTYDNIGIVQANHISTRNRNFFMKLFHIGVNSHWPTYQTMKHFYGFSTMLGHGAMIKRDCYEKAGGFPNLVAEDLCLSIEARNTGYYVAFAPNIICEEEYPIDYVAFKKRHSKWTQGNLEFIKKYTHKIAKSKMKWYEKMDIVLFTYNLPLTAVFAFYIFLNLIFAPLLGIDLGQIYSLWMIVPTVIFFFSPMLNDFLTWIFKINIFRFVFYFFCVIILYGSMLTTSLVSALLGMFGKKAKFIVTPKTSNKMTLWFALKFQWKEFLFSTILLVLSLLFCKSILPVILIILTGYLSFILIFFSNKKYDEETTRKIDEKTSKVSLAINKVYAYNVKVNDSIATNEVKNNDGELGFENNDKEITSQENINAQDDYVNSNTESDIETDTEKENSVVKENNLDETNAISQCLTDDAKASENDDNSQKA